MSDLIERQATIDYLIANVPHDDYGDELDADELREMWTERINKIPSAEPHLVNESQGLVKELVNKDYALRSIEQYIDKFDCIDVNFLDGLKTAMQLIRELPSAEPQERKTGKWILNRSGAYCCSKCMEPCATYVMLKPRDKFCKMCGSRNEVTE